MPIISKSCTIYRTVWRGCISSLNLKTSHILVRPKPELLKDSFMQSRILRLHSLGLILMLPLQSVIEKYLVLPFIVLKVIPTLRVAIVVLNVGVELCSLRSN